MAHRSATVAQLGSEQVAGKHRLLHAVACRVPRLSALDDTRRKATRQRAGELSAAGGSA